MFFFYYNGGNPPFFRYCNIVMSFFEWMPENGIREAITPVPSKSRIFPPYIYIYSFFLITLLH
jgi:hypothetical protein